MHNLCWSDLFEKKREEKIRAGVQVNFISSRCGSEWNIFSTVQQKIDEDRWYRRTHNPKLMPRLISCARLVIGIFMWALSSEVLNFPYERYSFYLGERDLQVSKYKNGFAAYIFIANISADIVDFRVLSRHCI